MNLLASMKYLVALNEHRHFARAAEACHITQPALSNALRALEEEFGVVIVHRGRTFAGLTQEGEQVLSAAQRMLHEQLVLQQTLKSTVDRPAGGLTIGAVMSSEDRPPASEIGCSGTTERTLSKVATQRSSMMFLLGSVSQWPPLLRKNS
eukprot:gene38254-61714_t